MSKLRPDHKVVLVGIVDALRPLAAATTNEDRAEELAEDLLEHMRGRGIPPWLAGPVLARALIAMAEHTIDVHQDKEKTS